MLPVQDSLEAVTMVLNCMVPKIYHNYHLLCPGKIILRSKMTEEELQYIVSFDAKGNPLEGVRNYKFSLTFDIPSRYY